MTKEEREKAAFDYNIRLLARRAYYEEMGLPIRAITERVLKDEEDGIIAPLPEGCYEEYMEELGRNMEAVKKMAAMGEERYMEVIEEAEAKNKPLDEPRCKPSTEDRDPN